MEPSPPIAEQSGNAVGRAGHENPPSPWKLRFLVVHALQLPAVGLAIAGLPWPAALWGSVVCCAGTDSGWRWLNRILIAQAVAWLVLALGLTGV